MAARGADVMFFTIQVTTSPLRATGHQWQPYPKGPETFLAEATAQETYPHPKIVARGQGAVETHLLVCCWQEQVLYPQLHQVTVVHPHTPKFYIEKSQWMYFLFGADLAGAGD